MASLVLCLRLEGIQLLNGYLHFGTGVIIGESEVCDA